MGTTNIVDFARRDEMTDALTELLKTGAQQLIATAVEAELVSYLAQFTGLRTDAGHAAVVRNGHHPARPFQTGIGPVSVRIPKVRSKDGTLVTFRSALVPPYVRRTKTLEAALPWLYLKGISSGEMAPALKVLLGPDAVGLSANTVSRLKRDWANEYEAWKGAELDDEPIVYIWADGVHSGLRGEDDKLCALVIIGVTARGKKRFLAIEDGVRESTQSWREVLLNLKSRGMNAPKLAIGDGAMGFWAAMDEVYPETRHQRCWQHKTMNVLNCLPKLSQPKAKAALHDIWQAETKVDAEKAFDLFIKTYEPKYPKATLCLQKDREELMAFFDFPAQHWQSIRTSNPIESAFATIRHRTKRSKGCLSRDGMLHMMFKLRQCAEQNWRKLRGFDYLAKVITGVTFKDGIETTNPDQITA
ncbi:IS256 family transposase [Octadecabacter arcticus 238]|uniref:Mutator family transposase n=1 Tax=Octadecabacter arcticus 238 TaxID=391616 RepID=M9RV11_9RHOB|nr:IS256-like element ISOan6 family transposase [Octadecabacter arcticus]AGI74366.1 IS256 family transposase [Octadecabacter arcticus 238]